MRLHQALLLTPSLLALAVVPGAQAAITGAGVEAYMSQADWGTGFVPCPILHPVKFTFTQYNSTSWVFTVGGPEAGWCSFGGRTNYYYDTGYWANRGYDKTTTHGSCTTSRTTIDPFIAAGPFSIVTTNTDSCSGTTTTYRYDLVSSGDNST